MNTNTQADGTGRRRRKRRLTAAEKYDIWLKLTREAHGPSGDLGYRVRAGRLDRALRVLAPVLLPPAPLRHAETEAAEVARRYRDAGAPTTAVLGAKATKVALRRRLGEHAAPPTVVHLALHGASIESDTPLESWLLLADSQLDGIDLTHWRLDGATVVLSACSSGQRAIAARGMEELPGDDLFGLQAAFFASGARQVVGALWPVNDRVTRRVTAGLHEQLLAGATADVALRDELVDLLDGSALYGAVNYWAPWYVSCLGAPATLPAVADRQEPL